MFIAEELVQEALTRVERRFARIDAPVAYTRAVLVNLARKHGARDARRRDAERAVATAEAVSDDDEELFDLIEALPFRQRAVFVLRYFADLTETNIARANASSRSCRLSTGTHRSVRLGRGDMVLTGLYRP